MADLVALSFAVKILYGVQWTKRTRKRSKIEFPKPADPMAYGEGRGLMRRSGDFCRLALAACVMCNPDATIIKLVLLLYLPFSLRPYWYFSACNPIMI